MPAYVEIEGLKELQAELRAVGDGAQRELAKVLRAGAEKLRARAVSHVPQKTGTLAGSLKVYGGARAAGIKSSLPYAGVQEFARTYKRRSRSGGDSNTVHLSGTPPRFGYRALDELREELTEDAFKALVELCKAQGWFHDG